MEKPLVSIIIPAYNASNYLAEAIDSVLAQTYKNYEIIVIDDGSKDEGKTREVALGYGDKIRYYEKENGGCASALNYGLEVMKGDYFSWLSHDDLYLPKKLEELLALVDKYHCDPNTTVLGCNDLIMRPSGKVQRNLFNNTTGMLSPVKAFGETLNVKTINGCGLLIPKEILNQVGGFRTDYRHLLDRELWMRIALNGFSYCYADEPLVISRVHEQQVTVKEQESLFLEESKLITEYVERLISKNNDKIALFLPEICYFAYKRNHIHEGEKVVCILKERQEYTADIRNKRTKYTLEGTIKRLVRSAYKKAIRR